MTRALELLAATVLAATAAAQEPAIETASGPEADEPWIVSIGMLTYSVPEDRDYVQTTITADRGWLHVEARHNYEDLDTGSFWFGANFAFGEDVTCELTPMFGVVGGATDGIAPGYRGTIGWWQLELYSEGEYLFDSHSHSDNFFYSWTELTLSVTDWLRIGGVFEHTKAYETDFDIQRGLLLGLTFDPVDVAVYAFNLDEAEPTFVFGFGVGF